MLATASKQTEVKFSGVHLGPAINKQINKEGSCGFWCNESSTILNLISDAQNPGSSLWTLYQSFSCEMRVPKIGHAPSKFKDLKAGTKLKPRIKQPHNCFLIARFQTEEEVLDVAVINIKNLNVKSSSLTTRLTVSGCGFEYSPSQRCGPLPCLSAEHVLRWSVRVFAEWGDELLQQHHGSAQVCAPCRRPGDRHIYL